MDTNEEIIQVVREQFADGEPFTVNMVASAADASVAAVTRALASLPDGELESEGRVDLMDSHGKRVGQAYAYRYHGPAT